MGIVGTHHTVAALVVYLLKAVIFADSVRRKMRLVKKTMLFALHADKPRDILRLQKDRVLYDELYCVLQIARCQRVRR